MYKIVEQELLQKKARLASKVPDIRKALEIVILLMDKQDQEVALLTYSTTFVTQWQEVSSNVCAAAYL